MKPALLDVDGKKVISDAELKIQLIEDKVFSP